MKGLLLTACSLVGAVFILKGPVYADATIQDAVAPTETVGNVTTPEPFVDPIASKKRKVISGFGKRSVPGYLLKGAAAPVISTPVAPSSSTPGAATASVTEPHEGIDYAAAPGTPVSASRRGKVLFAGSSKQYMSRKVKNLQSKLVIIRHNDGMSTRYVHMATLKVKPGQEIEAGVVLGTVASSDEWKEPVLHFEIRDVKGQALDPIATMAASAAPGSPATPTAQ